MSLIFQGFMKLCGLCGLFRPSYILYSNYIIKHDSMFSQHWLMAQLVECQISGICSPKGLRVQIPAPPKLCSKSEGLFFNNWGRRLLKVHNKYWLVSRQISMTDNYPFTDISVSIHRYLIPSQFHASNKCEMDQITVKNLHKKLNKTLEN